MNFRLLLSSIIAVVLLPVVRAENTLAPAFFEKHCYECHDSETKKGDLDLTKLKMEFDVRAGFEMWVKVHDLVERGEMPPAKKKKRPAEHEVDEFVSWTEKQLIEAETKARAAEGRALIRRLTRVEYENTVRDLLQLGYLKLREMLPADGTRHGYDRVGEALDLSHVQLSRYMEAADVALGAAIATRPAPPPVMKKKIYPAESPNFTKMVATGNGVLLKNFKPDPLWPVPGQLMGKAYMDSHVEANKAGMPESKSAMGLFHPNDNYMQTAYVLNPLYAGKYRLRISLWSFMWNAGSVEPSPRTEVAMLHVGPRTLGYFDAPSLQPKVIEIEPWLNVGDEVFFDSASLYLREKQVRQRPGGGAAYVGPGIATDWLDVEGPIFETWPPESHKRIFGSLPIVAFDVSKGETPPKRTPVYQPSGHNWPQVSDLPPEEQKQELFTVASKEPLEDAAKLLRNFLNRAFRRPATDEEVKRYVSLVQMRLTEGDCFEDAMRYACKSALTSLNFLFRIERPGLLDDYALASRLSFWLWNSGPDDELLSLAREGKLKQPVAIKSQVERMLSDPKSERFVEDFLAQWLKLRDIDSTDPDSNLYPDYHLYLKESMLGESHAFFRELIDKNLSATNIVSSDFLMLNERLAEHYLLSGLSGSRIRKVALPDFCERGGFITQGSVMKVTANGTTTSPVIRGIWLNERILGIPVPPPPPGVPAIDPDTKGATTIREQLVKHRADPKCAACHEQIDPGGFALESYDVIGGYRVVYRSLGQGKPTEKVYPDGWRPSYKLAQPVETAGRLPDGTEFKGIRELRSHLLKNPEQIARNFVNQLVTYATGAEPGWSDRVEVNRIVDASKAGGYGIRDLIHLVAASPLFQKK